MVWLGSDQGGVGVYTSDKSFAKLQNVKSVALNTFVAPIVEKKELSSPQQKIRDDALVSVRVTYAEAELKRLAKMMGGRWDPDVKLWYIPFGKIKGTELEEHIILDAEMKNRRT